MRGTLTKWNKIDLDFIKTQHLDKSISHCFELLVARLRTLYHGLSQTLQTDEFFHNKLILACRNTPACQIACSSPPETLNGLITSLKSSITTYEHTHKNDTSAIFMTDRRYHGNDRFQPRSQFQPYTHQQCSQYQTRTCFTPTRSKIKRCFICKKEDC
jgi:hypothetical protein